MTLSELLAHKSFDGLLSNTAVSAVRVVLLEVPVRVATPGSAVHLVMLDASVRVAMLQRSQGFRPLLALSARWTLLVLDHGVVLCLQGLD